MGSLASAKIGLEGALGVGVTAAARGTNTGAFRRSAALVVNPLGVAGGVMTTDSIGTSTAAAGKAVVLGGSRRPESLASATVRPV